MEKKTWRHHPILLLLCYLFTSKMATAQIIPIRVGVVIDTDDYGKNAFTCLSMALSDFYTTHDHYKTRLSLTSHDSKGSVVGAAAAGLDLLKNVQVQAIIGPTFSVQANFLISLGNQAQVPIISFAATSPSLTSLRSPYFIRATLNDSSQVDAIGAIIQAYGWREVVPIYEDNEFGEGIIPYLTDVLEQANIRVTYRSVIPPLATDDQLVAELYKLMTMQTRVFVVHMLSTLASRLFTKAEELGMMSQDYAWIVTDSITNDLNSMDPSVIETMLGVIGVKPYVPKTKELDEFAIRYKKRVLQSNPRTLYPDLDIYRLWAHDSAVALAMAAERARLRDTKYLELNVSRNSTDLEAFGVSVGGPRLIQALSSTTFEGLAGDFRLVDGQLQAPPYQIVNIVGVGARGIGYWTKENGIVKELNFTSVRTYSTSKSNLGSAIWPGDKSSPPKGWVVPTNGKKLRVGVPVKTGFTDFVHVTWNPDNSTRVEGFCIDVFDAVMAALPYGVPYEFIPFASSDHDMAGSYNDLAYQVYLGNYDAVAGDVTIVGNRSQYVDFTLPYTESGVSMVVPVKDDKSKNAWVFVKPLTWELWLTSFCSFVFMGMLIWVLEHRTNKAFRGSFWHQVGIMLWFAFSTVVFAQKEKVGSNPARFVLIVWFLVVLVLTQSYTASLTSMLTVQKLQPTITDIDELIRNKEPIGYMKGSFVYGFLKKMGFEESRFQVFDSAEQMNELLSKGSGKGGIVAAFHEIPYIKLFLGKYCSKYMMVGPTYKADGFGFVFPKGSPLVPDVSRAILNVTEGQKMVEIERKWLGMGDKSKCLDNNDLLPPRNLGLASFWGLFTIVAVVGALALIYYMIVFLHENWSVMQSSNRWSEKLRDLKNIFLSEKKEEKKDDNCVEGADNNVPPDHENNQPASSNGSNLRLSPPRTKSTVSPITYHGNLSATTNEQGEPSQIRYGEIELTVHQNENERKRL